MALGQTTQKVVGYQVWRHLLFVHWRVDATRMQALLPDGLTIETFDGTAWLAVVPFSMERVRPWWSPPVPGISWFLETNVRTYVRHANGQTGVWFFSLDANHRLAVTVACRFWHLKYRYARMGLQRENGALRYTGRRPDTVQTAYEIAAHISESDVPAEAEVGSLEHFLLERYHLFAQRPDGRFLCGQVHHEPYRYQPASLITLKQTLTAAMEYPITSGITPDHVAYSLGVQVSVSDLKLIGD
jgi:uncharacterized protein